MLSFLAAHPDKLVSKDQLLSEVWRNAIVSDASVKVCIREIRAALGDGIKHPKYIETVHRRGYRFIGLAQSPTAERLPPSHGTAHGTEIPGEPSASTNVVGRTRELSQLVAALADAAQGRRRCIFIAGGAGAGKTALLEAFQHGASNQALFLKGHCFEQFTAAEPYMPIWEALGRLPQRHRPAVDKLLARHPLTQIPETSAPNRFSEPRGISERLLRELLGAIEDLAAEHPLVLLIEDIHWGDYSTLDLVTALARRRSPAKLLLLATYRREGITPSHPLRTVFSGLAAASLCSELSVGLLDISGVEAFLAARLPGRRFPPAFARRLHQRTNGHPLFLVHLVNDLIDQGLFLSPTSTDVSPELPVGWRTLLETRVPWTVRAMIEGDVERLPENRREVLEAAAVAGIEFSAASVAAIIGTDLLRVDETCDALVRLHRFLEPRGVAEWPDGTVAGKYAFVHEMYHNVVYERLSVPRRMRMHKALAERIERAWGPQPQQEAAALANHFEQGRDWAKAVKYLRLTAAAASRQYAHREALQSLRRAANALEHLSEADRREHELDVLMALAVNLRVTEGCAAPEVREIHERAYALCEIQAPSESLGSVSGDRSNIGDLKRVFPVLWGTWVFHKVRSDLPLAETMAGRLLTIAQTVGDASMELQARQAIAVTALCLGKPELTIEQMHLSARIYDPKKHCGNAELFGQDPAVATLSFGAAAHALLGNFSAAAEARDRAIRLASELNQPSSIALATHFAAMTCQLAGDAQNTAAWARETIDLSSAEGYSYWLAGSTVLAGWAQVMLTPADPAQGLAQIHTGLGAWQDTGSRTYLPYFHGLLAQALLQAGDHQAALATVNHALSLIPLLHERLYERQLHTLKQKCLTASDLAFTPAQM